MNGGFKRFWVDLKFNLKIRTGRGFLEWVRGAFKIEFERAKLKCEINL